MIRLLVAASALVFAGILIGYVYWGDTDSTGVTAVDGKVITTDEITADSTENREQAAANSSIGMAAEDILAEAEPTKEPEPVDPDPAPSPAPPAKEPSIKDNIDADYFDSLAKLQASCTAKTESLLSRIESTLVANPEVRPAELQEQFLGDLTAAEAGCDQQFHAILVSAEQAYRKAGVALDQMPDWQTRYDQAKARARAKGLTVILTLLMQSKGEEEEPF